MSIEFRVIPHLFTFAMGAFAGLLAVSLLVLPGIYSDKEKMHQSLGDVIAASAADQATDAMLNQNNVRLQLILQKLEDHKRVQFATIHDVENMLIVQAGESIQNKDLTSHTSPIVLHDSIAGYVTIFLSTQNKSSRSYTLAILVTASLILSIAIWSLIQQKAINLVNVHGIFAKGKEQHAETDGTEQTQSVEIEEPPKVYAVILIKNLNVLQQQLNAETLDKTLGRVGKITKDVLALYNGAGFEVQDNYYILSFNASDTTDEALFRAVCSAHLIQELASIVNNIPLDLAALVSANKEDLTPTKVPVAGILLEETAAEDEQILRRIQFMEVGADNQKIVSGFEQPFKSLLENQRKQLSNLL